MAFKAILGAACVALFASNLSAGLPSRGDAGNINDAAVATDMRLSKLSQGYHQTMSDFAASEVDPVDVLITSISADPTGMSLPKPIRAAGAALYSPAAPAMKNVMYFAPALVLILGGCLGLTAALTWRKRMAPRIAG